MMAPLPPERRLDPVEEEVPMAIEVGRRRCVWLLLSLGALPAATISAAVRPEEVPEECRRPPGTFGHAAVQLDPGAHGSNSAR
jgi:hypothetical protein